jgi:cation transport ATPase
MDPENVTQSAQSAEGAAKSAATAGEKAKKAWEWGEHIHFAHFLWTSVLLPAPAVILSITHWAVHTAASFWSLLVLTAPLTIAVTLVVRGIRQKDRLTSGYWTYLVFPAIALLGSAYISSWSGIGKAFDWHAVLPHGIQRGQLGAWMLVPLAALGAYYEVYGAGPFFISLIMGIALAMATSSTSPY